MKSLGHTSSCLFGILLVPAVHGAVITQTFESGEDAVPTWNSTWSGGATTPGFLDPAFGGASSGGGASLTQSYSRSFRDNTVGLDVSSPYTVGMYVQVDAFDGPSGGLFEIVDGSFGSANAANLRILTEEVSPGTFLYRWQARDNADGWLNLGINMDLDSSYNVQLTIDPASFTYSAAVSLVDGLGNVQSSGSLSGLAFDQNVIGNGQNGNLLFYIQASAGGTDVRVDNINIQSVPEPAAPLLVLGSTLALSIRRRRPSRELGGMRL